ncbi:MAG: hypothetical protein CMJ30_07600 [Phycisphaerae bacterium]|nr:hypothetical protein [Phycisphaerae bacterium]
MTPQGAHQRLHEAATIRDRRQRPLGSTIGGVLQNMVRRFEKASEGQDDIRQIVASHLPARIPFDTIKEVRVRGRLVQLVVPDHGFKFHVDRWVRGEGLNVIRKNAQRSISSVKVVSR